MRVCRNVCILSAKRPRHRRRKRVAWQDRNFSSSAWFRNSPRNRSQTRLCSPRGCVFPASRSSYKFEKAAREKKRQETAVYSWMKNQKTDGGQSRSGSWLRRLSVWTGGISERYERCYRDDETVRRSSRIIESYDCCVKRSFCTADIRISAVAS